jgi:thiol-disulfide isomerase/thioredoxin/outer membrane lipoprotein-sorting protein
MSQISAILAFSMLSVPTTETGSTFDTFVSALNNAKTLVAEYTLTPVGGAPTQYKIVLSKPNQARIETPTQTILADGTHLSFANKVDKTFYKKPQTDAELKAILKGDSFKIWSGFFGGVSSKDFTMVKEMGVKNRRGMSLSSVEIAHDKDGRITTTLYVDQADSLVKQAELLTKGAGGEDRVILNVDSIGIDGNAQLGSIPDGFRELSLEEMNSDKWYSSLEEAIKVATSSNRKIFVDFYADWCGPCKKLEREVLSTPEFKKLSKEFVFLKIDVDRQPAEAKLFNITAMPTQAVLDKSGTEIGRTVGYGNPADFYAFLNQYRN